MGLSVSRCKQLFYKDMNSLINFNLLTLPRFKDNFSNVPLYLKCELFLIQNTYMALNSMTSLGEEYRTEKDRFYNIVIQNLLSNNEGPTFIPILRDSFYYESYGIKQKDVLPGSTCIFIKITLPLCINLFTRIKNTILNSTKKVTHVVLGWDDNGVNEEALLKDVERFLQKKNIKYMFSIATCSNIVAPLPDSDVKTSRLFFDIPIPEKHISEEKVAPLFTYVPHGVFTKDSEHLVENHMYGNDAVLNGWLGAQHVLYRHESLVEFPPFHESHNDYNEKMPYTYYIYISASYVYINNKHESAIHEEEIIKEFKENTYLYPVDNIHIENFTCIS
jgi:hypothetical protein